jgi:hypothetical protein
MFSNGIYVQTHTGNALVAEEATYHRERLLEAARDARLAKRARTTTGGTTPNPRTNGLDRLRSILHRPTSSAPAAR